MYERFFGFRENPFALTPNPHCVVPMRGHREAISNIEYAIASRKGITLLTGEAGCGKTTVIRTAIARQPAPVHCIHVTNPALTRQEFVEMLAESFGLSARARQSKATLLLELEQQLRARHAADETTALLIDEAQSVSRTLLEEIRLLANLETHHEKLLSIILVGQPELARRLDDVPLNQLKQRIAHICELQPLTETETAIYILSRIRWAGGVAAHTFSLEAVKAICRLSRGIPRIVNVIADNALISGLALGQRPVSVQTIEEVARELRLERASLWSHQGQFDRFEPESLGPVSTTRTHDDAEDFSKVRSMPPFPLEVAGEDSIYARVRNGR